MIERDLNVRTVMAVKYVNIIVSGISVRNVVVQAFVSTTSAVIDAKTAMVTVYANTGK
jgi:hypothetical protein